MKSLALAAAALAGLAAVATTAEAASIDAVGVRQNATIASRTTNVASVVNRGTGIVEVKFRVPTKACMATATPKTFGDPLDFDVPVGRTPFFIQTVYTDSSSSFPGVDFSKSIIVITHNKAGTRAAVGFDLHLLCP